MGSRVGDLFYARDGLRLSLYYQLCHGSGRTGKFHHCFGYPLIAAVSCYTFGASQLRSSPLFTYLVKDFYSDTIV